MSATTRPRIMFSVAEVSGDLHAADLARNLRRLQPSVRMFGLGGERMAEAGVDVRLDVTSSSTFGLRGLLLSAGEHLRSRAAVRRMLESERPDLVVLVDAPALNLPAARLARRLGIRTVYYVPPQTWLWNPDGAARRLRDAVDLVIPIFEDEAALYRRAGASVAYCGHPLADLSAAPAAKDQARRDLGFSIDRPVIGLFPGSRRHEIAGLLPLMMDAVARVEGTVGPLQVAVGVASRGLRPYIERVLGSSRERVTLSNRSRDVLMASHVNLAASGTVLFEAAALNAPAIMTYQLDRLSHLYGKYVLRVRRRLRFYAMPNIIAGEPVIPELVLRRATAGHMAETVLTFLCDQGATERMIRGYSKIRGKLGEPGVAARVAGHVLGLLNRDVEIGT